jgi:CHAT domain-containing protein/tetratricopeptide (TPR) repeat protein
MVVEGFLLGAGPSAAQAPLSERMSQISEMIASGKFKEAAISAAQLIQKMPALEASVSDQIKMFRLAGKAEYQIGEFQKSQQYNEQALVLVRGAAQPDREEIASIEADVAVALRNLGRYGEAEQRFKASYDAFQQTSVRNKAAYSDVLVNYSILLYQLSDLDRAADLTDQAIKIRRVVSPPAPASLAQALDNFGTILMSQGRLSLAEPPLQEALRIRRETLKAEHPDIAASLNNLGTLQYQRGEYAQADGLFREAIAIDIAAYGEGDAQVLLDLNNLAETLRSMGRPDEALELQMKILSGRERQSASNGADEAASYDLALSNANVANLLSDLGRDPEALAYYLKALTLDEKRANGRPSVEIATDLNSLGDLMRESGKPDEAEAFLRRGIQITEQLRVSGKPMRATLYNNLGALEFDQGSFDKARISFQTALDIRTEILPPEHKDLAVSHAWLAETLSNLGDLTSLVHARKALTIVVARGNRLAGIGNSMASVAAEARTSRLVVEKVLSTIARSGPRSGRFLGAEVADDALAALQIAQSSGTAVVAARTAVATLSSDPNTAALMRDISDLNDRRELAAQKEAGIAASPSADHNPPNESSAQIQAQIETKLQSLSPEFIALVRPPTLTFAAIRQNLEVGQGWLGFVVGSRITTVVLVTGEGVEVILVGEGANKIAQQVQHLVEQLDPAANRPFDLEASYSLYGRLLGSIDDDLKRLASVVVCSDGPLESLPLSVLVTSEPTNLTGNTANSYRRAEWLSNRSIIQLTPSFETLIASRRVGPRASTSRSFIGFGNPSLGPPQDLGVVAGANVLTSLVVLQGTGEAVTKVSEMASLPETADQLAAMNALFGGTTGHLVMGPAATRDAVLTADLSGFRVIAFATHGLLATKNTTGEPALVMTPIPGHDDGLLTATDIARLKLDADLVILSACNTAAPRTGYAADGLSGLSRAFFQAGARTIVISHWPVDKIATTTLMEILSTIKGESIAVAFNHAARSLRNDQPFAHPAFWAPFSLVGDGKEALQAQ